MIARGFASQSYFSSLTALLLLCLAGMQAQGTIAPYDCFDPNNRELTFKVRRGEITTICLYIGPGGDWNSNINYKRFSANLIADEFSSYDVPGSFNGIANQKNNGITINNATHIFAASQSSLSFLRRYYDKTAERIFPYLTAIIDVRDGVVRGIAWDDACIFCEKKQCLANTYNLNGSVATSAQIKQSVNGCYLDKIECQGFMADGSNKCDLKLYVVWTGTDADGKVLLSSDSRFSMFPPNRIQENVQGQYDTMKKNIENTLDKIPGFNQGDE
ncbi:hypothetical protein ACHAXR_005674 [Thalassiosira sp. AJA248-18]